MCIKVPQFNAVHVLRQRSGTAGVPLGAIECGQLMEMHAPAAAGQQQPEVTHPHAVAAGGSWLAAGVPQTLPLPETRHSTAAAVMDLVADRVALERLSLLAEAAGHAVEQQAWLAEVLGAQLVALVVALAAAQVGVAAGDLRGRC
jgi:hypothetical protein